jgi:hypothetical protein
VIAGVFCAATASAERKETSAQVFKPGSVVKLRSLAIEVTLPKDDEWSVSIAVDGSESWDILRRADGAVGIELSRSRIEHCSILAERHDGEKRKRIENPSIPYQFEPWAYEIDGAYRICTNTINGPVVADVTGNIASVNALLEDVARSVGGHREASPLIAKGPLIVAFGPTLLAASGINVDIPKGWTLHTVTTKDGHKQDLLERFEPRDPPLFLTLERVVGTCPPLAGYPVTAPPYLPPDLASEGFETKKKVGKTGMFCASFGPDSVIVRVTYTNDDDARVVRGILAPAGAARDGVGSSMSSNHDVDSNEEDSSLIRGVLSFDITALTHDDAKPFGVGAAIDTYGFTPSHGFGYGLELGVAGGIGTQKLGYFDAHAGIGPAYSIGRLVMMPTVGGGIDLARAGAFEEKAAGYVYGGGRLVVPLWRRATLGGTFAYDHRFAGAGDLAREVRGSLIATVGNVSFGLRFVDYGSKHVLMSAVLGLAL